MSLVHIHLMTNHFPVIGTVIGLSLLIVGMAWKSADIKRFSLYYFIVLGAATMVVFFTGEPAEDAIEHLPGIVEQSIERHESASAVGLFLIESVAILSAVGLVFKKAQLIQRTWFVRALFGLVIIATATMGWVANLGGKIRHDEISAPERNEK